MTLTLDEARERARLLSEISYDVELDVTAEESFRSRTTVRFTAAGPETFLELSDAADLRVSVDGRPLAEPEYDGRRLWLRGLAGATEVIVDARLPYVTDGAGMHAMTDPADGERYVSAYVGMDVAQRVLACFDQPDLKATFSVAVTAPEPWTVLANGRELPSDGGTRRFSTTPPIPTYLFVVCAGPWHSVTWEHAGLPFGWHARRSLAADLDRDAADLRAVTEACFDHYAAIFEEPYPFDSYDQALVPGLNWGAMETAGCVTFREELLPRDRTTEVERTQRGMVVAHEMAHMWFGDLVTMRWWEDSWLNESFADYMGFRVAEQAAGFADALLSFEVGRKPTGYDADLRSSTHPVAALTEEVVDVETAYGIFDMISYAKGNAVVRQLVTWLGDEAFLAGVNRYFARHRFGSATLADFVAALAESSDRDVHGWVESWLRTSGYDTLRVRRDGDVPVLVRDGSRPHRVRVTAYDDGLGEVGSRLVDVGSEPVRLGDWAGRVVVPNSHGETFAGIRLDDRSWAAVRAGLSGIGDPLVRGVLWACAFDRVQRRDLPTDELLALVAGQLPAERQPDVVEAVVARVRTAVVPRRTEPAAAPAAYDVLAAACRDGLAAAPDPELAHAFAGGVAGTARDTGLLHRWLAEGRTDGGLALDPTLRWTITHRLAELGALDAEGIEAERRRDGSTAGELGAATALAARPDPAAKEGAWEAMQGDHVSNRMFGALARGLWSVEQPGLVAPYVERYLQQGPALAERRGPTFAQGVGRAFPTIPLATQQVAAVDRALAGDLPTVLRRIWQDRRDDLR